jgi:hypothetical protein
MMARKNFVGRGCCARDGMLQLVPSAVKIDAVLLTTGILVVISGYLESEYDDIIDYSNRHRLARR